MGTPQLSPAALRALLHVDGAIAGPADLLHHWNGSPLVVLPLLAVSALYAHGLRELWRRGGTGRSVSRARAGSFAAGIAVLVLALVSPVDAAGAVLFSAHMVQHLLLTLVAAPLLVIGAPERVVPWAVPVGGRKALGSAAAVVQKRLGVLAHPAVAVAVATAGLWSWHLPALYDLAIRNEAAHALEHSVFLTTALVFWWSLLHLRTLRADRGNGVRLLALFAMVVQGSLLGALITLAASPLYASHANIPAGWALTPLEDQQLAGLIMWVPPAALYLAVAGHLFVRWLEAAEARPRRRAAARTRVPDAPGA